MARHNGIFLTGSVAKVTTMKKGDDVTTTIAFINIVRGKRSVGDYKKNLQAYKVAVYSSDPAIMEKMMEWQEFDIVFVKGTISTRVIKKASLCSECGEKNSNQGILSYVTPAHVIKIAHMDSAEKCLEFLDANKEIGNVAYVIGALVRDPKLTVTKRNLKVTQYQLAVNRKYKVPGDPITTITDFPWVKSYGDNAVEDSQRLHVSSEVYIDGFLQARGVNRHTICQKCGAKYDWKDSAMELVPYTTEYIANIYTDEEIAEIQRQRAEQSRNDILKKTSAANIFGEDAAENLKLGVTELTDEDREAGFSDDD